MAGPAAAELKSPPESMGAAGATRTAGVVDEDSFIYRAEPFIDAGDSFIDADEPLIDAGVYEVEVISSDDAVQSRGRFWERLQRQESGRTSYADLEIDVETGMGLPPRRVGDGDVSRDGFRDVSRDASRDMSRDASRVVSRDGPVDVSGTDALEIDVSAQVEEDAKEVRRDRRARLLDSSLVLLEMTAAQASNAVKMLLTPESGRPWELLHGLYEDGNKARARADKATAEIVEELTRLIDRK
jgi:hypothetical protein